MSSGSTPFQKNSVWSVGEIGGPGTTHVELIALTEPLGALTCAQAFQAEPCVALERRRKGWPQGVVRGAEEGRTQEACIKPPGTNT